MTRVSSMVAPTRYARTAGAAYLLIILLALLTTTLVDSAALVEGSPAETAQRLLTHETAFRLGILGTLLMYACVVVLSACLFIVLRGFDENLARIAMLLRTSEGVLGGMSALLSLLALLLLHGGGDEVGLSVDQAEALTQLVLRARSAALDIVLVFVGLGGALFCGLFFASRIVPRSLAAWGVLTYVSMLGLAALRIVSPGRSQPLETVLYTAGSIFEVVFGCWLLVRGVKPLRPGAVGSATGEHQP